uniref:Laminin EGF-like domain-containing protein n=1 Tax=Tetraselmis sp. GSL018 TaxID=582737 RepID=A0A061QYW1_9CHLO
MPPSPPSSTSPPMYTSPPPSYNTRSVVFDSVLSDYNMEDLSTFEDMTQFRNDYISSVGAAAKLLGIESDPTVEILSITPGSIIVGTKVTFINDPEGAELFREVLSSNPVLAFPAFSGLGQIQIREVRFDGGNVDGSPPPNDGNAQPNNGCAQTRSGQSCCLPNMLDAAEECCTRQVDECGVCGGNSDSCATAVTIKVRTNRPGLTPDAVRTPAFDSFISDFKKMVAQLFASMGVTEKDIDVDRSAIKGVSVPGGYYEFEVPFKIRPIGSAITVAKAKAILNDAAQRAEASNGMSLSAVVDVNRSGVCGNDVCENGEMNSCPKDCGLTEPSTPPRQGSTCPSVGGRVCAGRGTCSSGQCVCNTGYSGADCNSCAEGYEKNTGGVCAEKRADVDPRDNDADADADAAKTRSIILGVVFGIVALLLIGLMCYYVFVIRKRNQASREDGLAFSSQQQVPASNEEPDIPTRQLSQTAV